MGHLARGMGTLQAVFTAIQHLSNMEDIIWYEVYQRNWRGYEARSSRFTVPPNRTHEAKAEAEEPGMVARALHDETTSWECAVVSGMIQCRRPGQVQQP